MLLFAVLYMQVDSCKKILYWNTEHIIYSWEINSSSFGIAHRATHQRVKINRFVLDTERRLVTTITSSLSLSVCECDASFKRSSLFWTEFDERIDVGYVMQLDYSKDFGQRLFQTSGALHAIFISRESE